MRNINLIPNATRRYAGLPPGGLLRLLVVVLIALLLISTGWLTMARNQLISIASAEQKKKDTLIAKLEHVNQSQKDLAFILDRRQSWESLTAKQTNYAKLLVGIATATPGSLRLTSLSSTEKAGLGLAGAAQNRNDVSLFIAHLNQIGLFQNVTLNLANAQADSVVFTISLELLEPKPALLPASPKPINEPGGNR